MKVRDQHAFSLVEVVIAIGIISFALLAIMGLMASSQKSDREATDDTLLPAMAAGALDELRRGPFPPSPATFYFNSAGTLQTDANGVPISIPNADFLYRCTVTISDGVAVASDKMKILYMRFFRLPSPSNTNSIATLHASLSKE